MPLNISGSIVNSEIVEELDKKTVPTRNLEFYLDPESPDCFHGMQNWGTSNTKNLAHSIGSVSGKYATLATGMLYVFDGSNDWIEYTDWSHPTSCTVMCWVNTQSTSKTICSNSSGGPVNMDYKLSSAGYLSYSYYDGQWRNVDSNPVAVNDDKWHHIAWTRSGTNMKMYKDGVMIADETLNSAMSGNVDTVGRNWSGNYFQGYLGDFRVYNEQLSETQMKEVFDTGVVIPTGLEHGDLEQWFPMHEGKQFESGGKLVDYSGRNRIGTRHNFGTGYSGGNQVGFASGYGSCKMFFDRSNDYVDMTGDFGISHESGSASLSFWIQHDSIDSVDLPINYGRSSPDTRFFNTHDNSTHGSGKMSLGVVDNANWVSVGSTTLTDYVWYHFVIINDVSNKKVYAYQDGKSLGSASYSGTFGDPNILRLGNYISSNYAWGGMIDEVAMWNVALTEREIQLLGAKSSFDSPNAYDARKIREKNLKGYWRNDGAIKWKDLSGNGNDGSVSGSPQRMYFREGAVKGKDANGMPVQAGSFIFDGIGHADTNYSLGNGVTNFSCVAWIRVDEFNNQGGGIDFSTNAIAGYLGLGDSGGNSMDFRFYTGTFVDECTVYFDDNEWHMWVGTYDQDGGAGRQRLYKDAVLGDDAAGGDTSGLNLASYNIRLGLRNSNSTRAPIRLGQVMIYKRTLTLLEVQKIFAIQRSRYGV
jgi:hypothetical protein